MCEGRKRYRQIKGSEGSQEGGITSRQGYLEKTRGEMALSWMRRNSLFIDGL